jgi:hypothetical protein
MKIKVSCTFDIRDNSIIDSSDEEEFNWLLDILNDKRNIRLILHSNDIGDSIAETNEFKYKIIK